MKNLTIKIQEKLNEICKTNKLFRSSINGNELWDLYIKSYNNDPKFRDPESSEHNCNLCKNFIRRYGNIVGIDDNNNIITMFDITIIGEYLPVVKALSNKLKSSPIIDVFFETYDELNSLNYEKCSKTNSVFRLGINKNIKRYTKEEAEKFGVVKPNETREFHHLHIDIPTEFVDKTGCSVESIMGNYRSDKEVFKRGMETISLDTLELVVDLINQGSLLDGTTHLHKIEKIIPLKRKFDTLALSEKDNWCWVNSYKFQFAKFRNELIGVLCSELSEGMDLNEACKNWNKRVDPINYMKTSAPITQKQIEEAKKFVQENGYEESFKRRFAKINDIDISEILHANVGEDRIKSISIFDSVKSSSTTRHKRNEFDGVEEVTIEKFMKDILPSCTSIEAYLDNKHAGNLVSLTTSENKNTKKLFKWNNNYSWTFNGNLAGKSQIKENVKAVGGKITGILRCSLQWNDEDTPGIIDLDLHCITPYTEIYYGNKKDMRTGGWLDVDMISPHKIGIENITWQTQLKDGLYQIYVRNFSGHTRQKGFKFEIEFDGDVYNYHYDKSFVNDIKVANITVKNGQMSIIHLLPETSSSKEIYGLQTNQFHKVNLVCLTPNYWGKNNVGNKHYLFMLENCKAPGKIRSFHNENLTPELLNHRKVLEVLANTTMIESEEKQLSGLGFNSTVKDELLVKCNGNFKRTLKIKF